MSESAAYQTLKSHFPPEAYIERIENVVGSGFPDVIYTLNGTTGFIEIKSPTEPKKPNTRLFGSAHKLSLEQENWFLRMLKAGGKCHVFIGTDKRWLLIPGKLVTLINEATITDLDTMKSWGCPKGAPRAKWESLLLELQK